MLIRTFVVAVAIMCCSLGAAANEDLITGLEAASATPSSLEVCAQMMDEATDQERQALAALKVDLMEKVSEHSRRSTALMQSAFECTKTAPFTTEGDATFRRAMAEWKSQHAVLAASMSAKLKASQ